jgi:hypothetical protein
MPVKLQKRVLQHVNDFYPESSDAQKKKLFNKFYQTEKQREEEEGRYRNLLDRYRNEEILRRRQELQDELTEEGERQAQNEEAAAPYGAKPIDYYQMRLKALGMDKKSLGEDKGRTIKFENGEPVGVEQLPGQEPEMSPQEKRALEIRKKRTELGTGDVEEEAKQLEEKYGVWGRRGINLYNSLWRGIDMAVDALPFFESDDTPQFKEVVTEARNKFPGGKASGFHPWKDVKDYFNRQAYLYNQYTKNKWPSYNTQADDFDITKPDAGTAVYLALNNLIELGPQLALGGGARGFARGFGAGLAGTGIAEASYSGLVQQYAKKKGMQMAANGVPKLVRKGTEKLIEVVGGMPTNGGLLYGYTFNHNLDDLVSNQGYSLDDPNTYKRAAQKSAVESSLEGVFDIFSFAKESPELIQGLISGKKGVFKQLGKNVAIGGATSGLEEAAQTASTLPFEISDARAQINNIKNKIATGEINPEEGQQQIQELEFTAAKIAKRIAGDAVVGVLTPVIMKVPSAIGHSIGPVEQKALGVAVNNPEEFYEALDYKVAKKKMSAEEADRMRSFYDQVRTQYVRALTIDAPVAYQQKTGLKVMKSQDALKLAVEAARFNSLSTEFTLATDDARRKEIKDAAALTLETMKSIRSGVDISKRRVSGEEVASIVSGQTPRGNFRQGQAERIITKSGFQQESIENEKDLEEMVTSDAETMGYVMDIRAGKLKVDAQNGGNVVVDENNSVIDGKKRIAQRYVDAFYGNQDEVERNRQAALASSNLAYNIHRRKQEQNNFVDESERERTTKFLESPVGELSSRLAAIEERLTERKSQKFQGIAQEGGLTEAQLEKDAQELRDEIAKHNEIDQAAEQSKVKGEFVPFIVTKAISGQETVNTALTGMVETNANELENSFNGIDAAIAAEVTELQNQHIIAMDEIKNKEYSGTPEQQEEARQRDLENLLYNNAKALALAGIKFDDLPQALANVTGVSPLVAEGVIKHMATENMLPSSAEILEALTKKAQDAVSANSQTGKTEAEVNMTPEDDAAIQTIEDSGKQAMMQIPLMARLFTWANNAIVNSKSQEEKTDASVLLNDPVAFLKDKIKDVEQQINEVGAPTPEEEEAIVKELNGQLKELTDALAQVEQITAISEAKKDEVMDGVQARVDAEKGAGEPVAGEQVKPTRVQEIKYQIEQLEAARDARIQDLVSKGATLKEATDIANFEMSEDDKKALSLLKDELNEIAKSGVVEKPKNEREKRAEEREVNKELTKNLTNIFNQMGVESPKRKKKNCP